MPAKKKRYRAIVGLSLGDGTRVEVGELVPAGYPIPADWVGRKVEEA